ncbi:MAG: cation diffusion facilitator family transporter [Epsilonproteobacteria bacterium]|nr:cation diffusion facilitator family transporter [Campylobacterota bacterium]
MTLQKKATLVASATSTLLIVIKLTIGFLSGSVAVLASAIDSVLDLIVSLFNFFAVSKAEKPADKTFNYGRGKIEALAAVIEGTVITVSGLYIFYEAVRKALIQEEMKMLDISIWVMLVSLVITIALVMYLNYVAKKTGSMVIKSDALHYKTDIFTNVAILVSLVAIQMTSWQIIDSIIGGIIAIYIIFEAYKIIKEGVYVLLDGALDETIVKHIEHILASDEGLTGYHFLKTRTSGHQNFVDVHLVFTSDLLLLEAHRVSDRIEAQIKLLDPTREWVMNMHLDPYDDSALESY